MKTTTSGEITTASSDLRVMKTTQMKTNKQRPGDVVDALKTQITDRDPGHRLTEATTKLMKQTKGITTDLKIKEEITRTNQEATEVVDKVVEALGLIEMGLLIKMEFSSQTYPDLSYNTASLHKCKLKRSQTFQPFTKGIKRTTVTTTQRNSCANMNTTSGFKRNTIP